MTARRVFVSAGEPSGDRHAGALVTALRRADPGIMVDAIGGPALRAAGAKILVDSVRLGAMGLTEAAGSVGVHLRAYRLAARRLRAGTYGLAVLVDYPGFHLALAGAARRAGIPVLYYIAPQLWAWGAWRASRLAATVSHLAVVLPFEEPFFRRAGIATSFVGHPLASDAVGPDRATAQRELGLRPDQPVLALFPGSRRGDVQRHWRAFSAAAQYLLRSEPSIQVVAAGTATDAYPHADGLSVVRDRAALVMRAADIALCKSGTATLEAALVGTPQVVAYRLHSLTYRIARRVVSVPWIALPNLVMGRQVVPELIQDAMTTEALVAALQPLLDREGAAARRQRAAGGEIRERLGQPGAADRTAALAHTLVA